MVERVLFGPGGSTEAKQEEVLAALVLLKDELDLKFEAGEEVALDATTLAALEAVNAAVTNWPTEFPLPDDQVTALTPPTPPTPQTDGLTDAELRASPLEVDTGLSTQTDALTDAELRAAAVPVSGNLTVDGEVALDAATLSALETVNAVCSGTVALDAGTLAALETITAVVSNWPAEFALPDAQVAALTPQTDGLTDVELRATPLDVNITGGGGGDGLTDAELRAAPVPVTDTGAQTDALTDAELRATPLPVTSGALTDDELRAEDVNTADSGEREYTHVVATVTASGDTTIHTPAAGKAIRLHWVYAINDPSSSSPPLIKVKVGATELYRVWALSKRQRKTGAVDASLVVNLSAAGNVAFTAILEEV